MTKSSPPQAQTSLFGTGDIHTYMIPAEELSPGVMYTLESPDGAKRTISKESYDSFSQEVSLNAQEPFGGITYQDKDFARLSGQLLRVFEVMKDGRWYGASQLCELANVSPLSITARIRDLRKARFGGHTIERKLISGGHHEYRLVV